MKSKWLSMPLGEFVATKRISVDPLMFPDEVFDLYSIPAFDTGEPEVVAGSNIGSTKQLVAPGDVLLSKIVPHIRRSWVVGRNRGRRLIASGEWIVFRGGEIRPRYLRHFLVGDSFHSRFMQTVSGVGGSLLRARPTEVAKILVPVPSLAEQERIERILDEADELRRLRRESDRRTADLIPAHFHEMFKDSSKGETKRVRLEKIAEVVSGVAKGRNFKARMPVEVPYLRVANVQAGYLDLSEIKMIQALPEEVEQLSLRKGDVLLTEGGDYDKLGRGALVERDMPGVIHQNHIFRVRVSLTDLDPVYFAHFLITLEAREYFLGCAKRTQIWRVSI